MKKPIIIGIAGGSCSGKTTLAKNTLNQLGQNYCTLILQDNYYHDHSNRVETNFDHPNAIDFDLLAKHLATLKDGQNVRMPQYNFIHHARLKHKKTISPTDIILVDGILILTQKKIVDLLDYSYFIECNREIQITRRVIRDTQERGRTEASVIEQLKRSVLPMHDLFVEPSKANADKIINHDNCLRLLIANKGLTLPCFNNEGA